MPNINFVSFTLRVSFYCLGIFKNRKHRMIYFPTIFILASTGIFGSIVGILNAPGAADKLEALAWVNPQMKAMTLLLSVHLAKKKIFQILETLKTFGTYDILQQSNQLLKKGIFQCAAIFSIQCITFATLSSIAPFMREDISDKFSLYLSFWFSCGDDGSKERITSICWRITSKKELLVANMIQGTAFILPVVFYMSSFALYGIIVGQVKTHLKNIKEIVDRFNVRNQNDWLYYKENTKKSVHFQRQEEDNYQTLLEIIKYQQFLHNCSLKIVDTWEFYLTFFYGIFFANLSAFSFSAVTEFGNSTPFVIRLIFLISLGVEITYFLAALSQVISTLNEDIFDIIINVKWYEQNMKFRKIYITGLAITLKPVRVVAGGIFPINLNSFLKMLRIVYSILNLLNLRYG